MNVLDESFAVDDDSLEENLCLAVRTMPVGGILWAPEDSVWRAEGSPDDLLGDVASQRESDEADADVRSEVPSLKRMARLITQIIKRQRKATFRDLLKALRRLST